MSEKDEFQQLAADAAQRIERQRDMGEQLSLIPEAPEPKALARGVGRPAGAKNKGQSQMREWMAARGYTLPEDVIAELAGMASGADAMTYAMGQAERVLAWAGEGASNRVWKGPTEGHVELDGPWKPTPMDRIETFKFFYTAALRAAEALLPYGAAKASPDVAVTQNTTFIVPSQPAPVAQSGPATARDITPERQRVGRMMPADLAEEMQQKQSVEQSPSESSDAQTRTDGAND